jgi:hypothetical protein
MENKLIIDLSNVRKKLVVFFLINVMLCTAQNKLLTSAPDSLFYAKNWHLVSVDSCGNIVNLPSETVYHFTFFDFSNKKTSILKRDKYYQKQGYNGKLLVYSEDKNTKSKFWSSIKAYYKKDNDKIVLLWDDDFKGEENFKQISSYLYSWCLVGLNATGQIVKNSQSETVFNMTQTSYKKEPICIKFLIKKD